jgi:hypothetical protein
LQREKERKNEIRVAGLRNRKKAFTFAYLKELFGGGGII